MRESASGTRLKTIAVIGNPNSGKSTVFNGLTGLRQKTANYPGVTVEKHEGRATLPGGMEAVVLDLPGTYSLSATSPDEKIAVDVLLGQSDHIHRPDLILCVADAGNLERNLYLVSQIIDRGIPVVLALNMVDIAQTRGIVINVKLLQRELGVPVVPMVASRGTGFDELREVLASDVRPPGAARRWTLPEAVQRECEELSDMIRRYREIDEPSAFHEALDLLTSPTAILERIDRYDPAIIAHVRKDHQKLEFLGVDRQSVAVVSRYEWIRKVLAVSTQKTFAGATSISDRIDRVLTHRWGGPIIFLFIMAFMFNAIFSWAMIPMNWIASGFDMIARGLLVLLPAGDLRDLLVDGALAGVANVVAFLPQIVLLFLFLALLEDSGYMARAAYIMDRVMGRVGLHGKSFIPLLSSFACAIPGIMAARTIENQRDRIATMFVAPFMSCSARLPVYTLLIGAFIPGTRVLGVFSLPGLVLTGLYLLGLLAALATAFLFKKTFLRRQRTGFFIELPPYKVPSFRSIAFEIKERAFVFVRQAGTIILGASILVWFLASYPKADSGARSDRLQQSFAGRAGRLIEPAIQPLGFNWKIGIGIVSSLFQREMFVSTLATIYSVGDDGNGASVTLQERLRSERDPVSGLPVFSTLTAVCLLVYYVLAMQCLSTVAVMRRETNSWRWPIFQFVYMTGIAYLATWSLYRVGLALGWGGG